MKRQWPGHVTTTTPARREPPPPPPAIEEQPAAPAPYDPDMDRYPLRRFPRPPTLPHALRFALRSRLYQKSGTRARLVRHADQRRK